MMEKAKVIKALSILLKIPEKDLANPSKPGRFRPRVMPMVVLSCQLTTGREHSAPLLHVRIYTDLFKLPKVMVTLLVLPVMSIKKKPMGWREINSYLKTSKISGMQHTYEIDFAFFKSVFCGVL